jgi:hypothetical protein
MTNFIHRIAVFCLLALSVTGCAGDLGAAREAAGKAASFVGDMQSTTLQAIEHQRADQQSELIRVAELHAAGQANLAMTNQYRATWQGASLKASLDLFKAMADLTPEADLSKSVPFVLIAPVPEFNAPAIDRKAFTDLIAKFNKLEEGMSPIERARALAPFVEVVVKSYKDSVAKAKSEPALVESGGTSVGTILSLSAPSTLIESTFQPEAVTKSPTTVALSQPIEELSNNEVPVNGLLSALSNQ